MTSTNEADERPLREREWLSPKQVAEYVGISLSSAYELVHALGVKKKPHVRLRVRRQMVDDYLTPPEPQAGTPAACPGTDDDDDEVLPGLTRRQLREQTTRST